MSDCDLHARDNRTTSIFHDTFGVPLDFMEDLAGRLGSSTFTGFSAWIGWEWQALLKVFSLSGKVSLPETHTWLMSYPTLKAALPELSGDVAGLLSAIDAWLEEVSPLPEQQWLSAARQWAQQQRSDVPKKLLAIEAMDLQAQLKSFARRLNGAGEDGEGWRKYLLWDETCRLAAMSSSAGRARCSASPTLDSGHAIRPDDVHAIPGGVALQVAAPAPSLAPMVSASRCQRSVDWMT